MQSTDRTDRLAAQVEADEEVWLLGQPALREYLDFVRAAVIGGDSLPTARLIAEWREANEYYQELEDRERGIADQAECRDLDPVYAPMAESVTSHPLFRRTFDTLPARLGMVELDKLIVYQKSVTGNFVESVRARIGADPDSAALFRLCMPLGASQATSQIRRVGSKRYVFRSDSTDFRFHESVLLWPEQVRDYEAFGPIAGIVGLVVGFGSNFLNVIRADDRLILHNGYHRACALKAAGVRLAPAVVQTVSTHDELDVAAKSTVAQNPDFYLRSARPPLLKDFFDERIRKALPVHKQVRHVEISFEVRDHLVCE